MSNVTRRDFLGITGIAAAGLGLAGCGGGGNDAKSDSSSGSDAASGDKVGAPDDLVKAACLLYTSPSPRDCS